MAFLLGIVSASAAVAMSAQQLGVAAESFARESLATVQFPVHVRAVALDERLTLPDCAAPPAVRLPPGSRWSARTLVQLRCESGARWSILIPVDIESEVPVLVLRSAAARGATLGASDFIAETRRVAGTSADYVSSPERLVRQHLRRNLGAGSVLTAADLDGDALVRRGQTVDVIAEAAGMRIQSEAVAMADARAGERVRLQNRGSLRIVEGVVDKEGVVRVAP